MGSIRWFVKHMPIVRVIQKLCWPMIIDQVKIMPRECTNENCQLETEHKRPFCEGCFKSLPFSIRNPLNAAWKSGDGVQYEEYLRRSRGFLRERRMVDVEGLKLIERRDRSFVVTDGVIDLQYDAPRHIYLPVSQCEELENDMWRVPEWMAKKKDLL